jgi:hypothetical protein
VQAITITRAQRDALYHQLVVDLGGIGDVSLMLEQGDYESARRFRREFEDDMRLLDDIGWERDATAERFELTARPKQLARAMRRLQELVGDQIARQARERSEEGRLIDEQLALTDACGSVLAQVARTPRPSEHRS